MRAFLALIVMLSASAQLAMAHPREFPYEAAVQSDGVEVLCGPGPRYFATTRLNRGDRVTVIRHDPGGWYMIAPPPGSFSWIDGDAVKPQGRGRGVVVDNNVIVRIGSQLGAPPDEYESVRLSNGAEVEIIDAAEISLGRGRRRMYKIKPPDGEYRWISGKFVAAPGDVAFQRRDSPDSPAPRPDKLPAPTPDSFQGPALSQGDAHRHHDHDEFIERPMIRTSNEAVRRSGPSTDELEIGRGRLKELDGRFRAMIDHDPSAWNLADLQHGYEEIQRNAASGALATQVALRLDAVERYRKIKHEYDSFVQLTAETDRRDANLLSIQQQTQFPGGGNEGGTIVTQGPIPAPVPNYPHPAPVPNYFPPVAYPNYPPPAPRPAGGPRPQSYGTWGRPNAYLPPGTSPYQGAMMQQQYPTQPPRLLAAPMMQNRSPAMQNGYASSGNSANQPDPNRGPQSRIDAGRTMPYATQAAYHAPQPIPSTHRISTAPKPSATQTISSTPKIQPFVGAGIVQRAAAAPAGAPQHVLIAPNGRILAYLQADAGVNLDASIGRSMGLHGQRTHRDDLRMDEIVVRDLAAVRLTE